MYFVLFESDFTARPCSLKILAQLIEECKLLRILQTSGVFTGRGCYSDKEAAYETVDGTCEWAATQSMQ